MRLPTIVVVSKFPDLFAGFRESVEKDCYWTSKILIRDGDLIEPPKGWLTINGRLPFSCARYGNQGWRSCGTDILYVGDDVRFVEEKSVERLQDIALSDSKVGMLSPKIIGGAQTEQNIVTDHLRYATHFIGMMCVYIKRSTIDRVGYLDEQFSGYGFEDVDYNKRIERAGLRIGITGDVSVKHGLDELGHSTTFRRTITWDECCQQAQENYKRYEAKYL